MTDVNAETRDKAEARDERDRKSSSHRDRPGTFARSVFIATAIVIPGLSILVELATRILTGMFHDPMPTWGHVVMLAFIPIGFVVGELYLAHGRAEPCRKWETAAFVMNGYVFTMALIYFVVYLPFLPIACIGVLAFGLGLFPLAPAFCLTGAFLHMRRLYGKDSLRGRSQSGPLAKFALGCALGLIVIGSVEAPAILVDHAIVKALSTVPAERARGMDLLDTFGGEEEILRRCYRMQTASNTGFGPTTVFGGRERSGDVVSARLFTFVGPSRTAPREREPYRALYFRLTGRPFNSVAPPDTGSPGLFPPGTPTLVTEWEKERVLEQEVGGEAVAARVEGVSLAQSSMKAVIDSRDGTAGPCLAQIEWTLEFRNDSSREREARTQIVLPHDAVASRLTLWIDGEEREAAFGSRKKVRSAYRDVAVVKRRDPALLTTMGADRLLLQCFPILPGMTMKMKIGISAPLCLRDGRGWLRLPHFAERNFSIPDGIRHALRAECAIPIDRKGESGTSIACELTEAELLDPAAGALSLAASVRGSVSESMPETMPAEVRAFACGDDTRRTTVTLSARGAPAAGDICLVVDGSATMERASLDWSTLCGNLPASCRVNAFFAGVTVARWKDEFVPVAPGSTDALAGWLAGRDYGGGRDPVPALEAACDLLSAGAGGTILWIHGPLPVRLTATADLADRLERGDGEDAGGGESAGGALRLLTLAIRPGPDRVGEELGDPASLECIPVLGSLDDTLAFAAARLAAGESVHEYALPEGYESLTVAEDASSKLENQALLLAAGEKVRALCRAGGKAALKEAANLATAFRIVTPVSGAVVLESKEDFERNDLKPPSDAKPRGEVPIVPEPEEWALIVTALAVFVVLLGRRRIRAAGSGS